MKQGERQVAPTVDGIRRDHTARYQWAAQHIKTRSRMVDFACGIGYGSQILAHAGHQVTGLDIDVEAIAYGREHYAHPRVTFGQSDAARPGKLPAHDVAVCFETIEHVADPRPLLKALHQCAGTLLASVPNEDEFPWQREDGSTVAFHHRHYTKAQFAALLGETGWEVTEWWGQRGPESQVEKGRMGRTIIAVAVNGKTRAAARAKVPGKKPVQTSVRKPAVKRAVPAAPGHVVLLGMGPSVAEYLNIVKRLGGRSAFCDEVWSINALGNVFDSDRVFHMDDVRIQEIRAAARPASNIAQMLKWMRRHPGPIYTSRAHPDYPGLVEFPTEDVVNHLNFGYFNSTAAYAVAYAVHIGVQKLSIFGNDFTYPNAHDAEKGRGCVEFWLGQAAARGIALSIPRTSSLMDACMPLADRLYGNDTRDIVWKRLGGKVKLVFTEKKTLPTADEIEDRYDHSRHPSPLVDQ